MMPHVAITYPENNYLTTSSSLMVRGTVKGKAGVQQPLLSCDATGSQQHPEFGQATFGETKFASVLTPEPGGSEAEVAQESVAWVLQYHAGRPGPMSSPRKASVCKAPAPKPPHFR